MSGRNENREKDHSLLVGETLCRTAKRSTSLDLSLSEQYWAASQLLSLKVGVGAGEPASAPGRCSRGIQLVRVGRILTKLRSFCVPQECHKPVP